MSTKIEDLLESSENNNEEELFGITLLEAWKAKREDGYTQKEWAEELDISYSALKKRLQRARERVRGDHSKEEVFSRDDNKVEDKTEGNFRKVIYKSPDIRSLEDLIRECDIDEDIWLIYKHNVNKWPIGAKLAERDLEFNDGRIDGVLGNDQLVIAPMIQITAYMVRKEPEQVFPQVERVEITTDYSKKVKEPKQKVRRRLIIPDTQIGYRRDIINGVLDPFHDRRAMDVVLQIANDQDFTEVTCIGDIMDWTMWTDHFLRDKEFYFTTQPALDETVWWLSQFRKALPNAPMDMIDSNHDIRLEKSLKKHMMASHGIRPGMDFEVESSLSIPYLLGFDKLGIEWIPGYPSAYSWILDNLHIEHGSNTSGVPGYSAKKYAEKAEHSVIFGHTHRIERAEYTKNTRYGIETIYAMSMGCLCRLDYVVPGHERGHNWQQAFGETVYTEDGRYHDTRAFEIKNGEVVYNGKLYRAREEEEILEALNDSQEEFEFHPEQK